MDRVRVTRSVAISLCGAAARAVIRSRARVALVIRAMRRTLSGYPSPPGDPRGDGVLPLPASGLQRGA